jgi:two-component system chemotaxis response regulator CheY
MRTILPVDGAPLMRQRVFFTLRKDGFELVPTDQNLPRLDGFGPTRQLRGSPDFESAPILILTTESSDQMKQAGRAAGATGWMVKPFDPAKLIEVIRKVIR